jgi:hypothetical protein
MVPGRPSQVLLQTSTGERAAVLRGAASELKLFLRWCDELGGMEPAVRRGRDCPWDCPETASSRTGEAASSVERHRGHSSGAHYKSIAELIYQLNS